jgi:chemotaxis protein histidine kinase CheA
MLYASAQMFGFDEICQLLSAIEEILQSVHSKEIQMNPRIIDSVTLAMEMAVDLMENRYDGRGETGYIVDRLKELKNEQTESPQSADDL